MPDHDIVVMGASAGGVEALSQVVAGLPADLPAALFVVLHISPHGTSALPSILSRSGKLPALHPADGEPIEPGRVYVAPPDRHLLVRPGYVRVPRGPRENGHRPAVDPLFRTAARSYGPRVIGVVLSGALDDGTAGLSAIKARGGVALVQDPEDALYPGMPESALAHVAADEVLPVAELAAAIDRWARIPAPADDAAYPVWGDLAMESDIDELTEESIEDPERPGTPSGFACPDCGGALWELHDGELVRFRCRVGHAWGADSLLAAQSEAMEEALWTALRALEERAALSDRMAAGAARRGHVISAERFEEDALETRRRAELIRRLVLNGSRLATDIEVPADAAPAAEARREA